MDVEENQPLTEWQVRIREASTPDELLRIAEELRMRSAAAQKHLLAETLRVQARSRRAIHKRTPTSRSNTNERAG